MEIKKTVQADLEKKRPLFLTISFVLAFGIILLAFSWKTPVKTVKEFDQLLLDSPNELFIPRTEDKKREVAPPPLMVDIIDLVSNETEIEDENLEIFNSEYLDEGINVDALIQLEKEEPIVDEKVYIFVDEMPEFPGGTKALLNFIGKSLKYPMIPMENGIQGKVYVHFVINKDGQVSDAQIVRGVDSFLDKEALRVVNMLPRWNPGRQSGKPVRVSYSVPISFVLQ